jgi:moderate conductance mechanosensitive channel
VPHLAVALADPIRQLASLLELDAAELTRRLLQMVLIWALCYLGSRAVTLIARRIERTVDEGDPATFTEREQRGRTISQLLRSVGRVFFLGLALLLTLNVFVDIAPILAGAGILGLAVSFGAQSLVKDVIAGFFFLVEGQFGVGDVIEVVGHSGQVERMTLRVVMLRDVEGVLHIIPNGQIVTVSNKTRRWSRAVVDVGVAYDSDVDHALRVFRDEVQALTHAPEWRDKFDGDSEVLGINELAGSQITIRTLLRTLPGQQWSVAREFRRRIKLRLDRERIEIPFPQRTLHLRSPGGVPPVLPGSPESRPATRSGLRDGPDGE